MDPVRIRWTLEDAVEWSEPMERWLAELLLGRNPSELRSPSGDIPKRACLEPLP